MEGAAAAGGVQEQQQQPPVERLNEALQQQLNLEQVKTRAIGLFKAISRILEDLDVVARANALPKCSSTLSLSIDDGLALVGDDLPFLDLPKCEAAGPAGFNAEFLKAVWPVCGTDIVQSIRNIFWAEFLSSGLNSTYSALIPKVQGSSKFSVLLNGNLEGFFGSNKGSVTGMVSPYLFTLVMEVLGRIPGSMKLTKDCAYHPKCARINSSHLVFAEDEVSLAALIGLQVGRPPFRYLGVPLDGKAPTVATYKVLIEKLTAKITCCPFVSISVLKKIPRLYADAIFGQRLAALKGALYPGISVECRRPTGVALNGAARQFVLLVQQWGGVRRAPSFGCPESTPITEFMQLIGSQTLVHWRSLFDVAQRFNNKSWSSKTPMGIPAFLINLAIYEMWRNRNSKLFRSNAMDKINLHRFIEKALWEVVLGQFSMVNLELFNIVDDIKKVSKAFVVYPKNVNAVNANVLPVMLSSKLLPQMEMDDNSKREQLLHGMQNLSISSQIDKLKTRIDMIAAACASAEKILAETRKAYGFGTRQGPSVASTLDKAQAAKIQEQENLLRAAVNFGEGLRVPADQRQITSVLPLHLVDVLNTSDGAQSFADPPGLYAKSAPQLSSSTMTNQVALLQGSGAQIMVRSAASPSGPSFNNTASPLPYTNSPGSANNMMNTPSPQQPTHQQQQRQRMLPQQQQQILAQQQQFRQAAMPGMGQSQMPQLHDLQSQTQQKLQQQLHGQHTMQYSQPLAQQQFQNRQLTSGHGQNVMSQNQLNQGNQLNRQMNQFQAGANTALYNAAQTTPNSQMMPNMSGTMPSQSQLPRMQPYTLPGTNPSRSHASQMMNDQMFNMGATNPTSMMQMQQHGAQGAFGNMATNAQNLQAGVGAMQNTQQNHPNYQQQRPPNQ
ncbi:unnamed protein product [Rhodiola kirilowii]